MSLTRRANLKLMSLAALGTAVPLKVAAEDGPVTHEVKMYTKHPENKKLRNVFVPDIVRAKPGDTIKFISEEKGHNSVSDKSMLPEGGEEWKSKINKDHEVTLTTEGTYGYYCTPHRALGMVGLILVGDPSSNYEAARGAKQKKKAAKMYEDIFKRADEMLAAEKEG